MKLIIIILLQEEAVDDPGVPHINIPGSVEQHPSGTSSSSSPALGSSSGGLSSGNATPLTLSPAPQATHSKTPNRKFNTKRKARSEDDVENIIQEYKSMRSSEQDFAYGFGVMVVSKMRELTADQQLRMVEVFTKTLNEFKNE